MPRYTFRCVVVTKRKHMLENGWSETEHFHVHNDTLMQVFKKLVE